MTYETIAEALGFVEAHGFTKSDPVAGDAGQIVVGYTNARMTIEASCSDRDGLDIGLRFTTLGGQPVSLGTLMGALRVDEGRRAQSSRDVLSEQVQWLQAHIHQVLTAPSSVTADWEALRFYHSGSWRREWGKAIVMDAQTQETERRRLDCLRDYFGPVLGPA